MELKKKVREIENKIKRLTQMSHLIDPIVLDNTLSTVSLTLSKLTEMEGNVFEIEWEENSNRKHMTWYEAVEYSENLGLEWRLPTTQELKEAYVNKVDGFNQILYWSGDDSGHYASCFNFGERPNPDDERIVYLDKDECAYITRVRCVRLKRK